MAMVGCSCCHALVEKLLKTDHWRTAGGMIWLQCEARRLGRKAEGEEKRPREAHDEGRREKVKDSLT